MRIFKRKGSPSWWATWYDQHGKRHRKSTGTEDKDLAQALAAKWQQESFMERHFGKIPDVPFRDALLKYAEAKFRENSEGYSRSTKYRLQCLLDRFDGLNLKDITAAKVQDFADDRIANVTDATVQKDLATLKAILNKAHREGRLETVPPFPRFKTAKGRCRWLTPEEEVRLLHHAPDHLKPIIIVAVDTGGRKSELLRLDWRHVDLTRGRLTFTETKNGEDRTIRMTDRVKRTLTGLLEDGEAKESGPVFTYRGKPMQRFKAGFETARDKANLHDFRFHDLRHTFASRLVQKGVPIYEVMHLTGHKSLSMVQRYAHLAPDFQAQAIAALNDFGHNMGTERPEEPAEISAKSLLAMVGAAGIEPATPAV